MEELRIQSGCTVSNVNSHSNSSSRRRKRTRSTAAAAHYHVSALSSSSSKRRQRSDEGGGLMGILSLCHCQSPLVLPISSHGTFSLSSDNKHDSLFPSSSSSSSSSFPLPPLLHGTTTQWHRRGRSIPPHSTLCHWYIHGTLWCERLRICQELGFRGGGITNNTTTLDITPEFHPIRGCLFYGHPPLTSGGSLFLLPDMYKGIFGIIESTHCAYNVGEFRMARVIRHERCADIISSATCFMVSSSSKDL